MRILQVHDKAPGVSGVRRHIESAAAVLRRAGHEVVTLRLLGAAEAHAADDEYVFPGTFRPWSGWRWVPALRRLLKDIRPDVIHLHGGYTSVSAPLLGTLRRNSPTVGIMHDVTAFCYLGTRRFRAGDVLCERRLGAACVVSGCYAPRGPRAALVHAYQIGVKRGLMREWQRLDWIVVPSGYLASMAVKHGFAPERLSVVGHFVWPEVPPVAEPEGEPTILYAGRLEALKGPQVLLAALQRLPARPWRCIIAGDGPDRDALVDAVARGGLGARVHFAGALSGAALDDAFRQCHVLAFPSMLPEAFGLSGLESLAYGRPVVGFPLGGVEEWLRDGETGLAAQPWSAESLADKLGTLLGDPALARKLGGRARRLVAGRFSPEHYAAGMAAVHEAVQGASIVKEGP